MIFIIPLVLRFGGMLLAKTIGFRSIAIAWRIGGLRAVVGFLFKRFLTLLFARFSIGAIWGQVIASVQFIFNFNWGASDKSLDAQISARWSALGQQVGGTFGNLFGWLACGILPGATLMAFNPALGAYVLKEVGEEALEELTANLAMLARTTYQATTQNLFIEVFKNARRQVLTNDKHPVAQLIKRFKGDKFYKDWQKAYKDGRSIQWTFAQDTENVIESIPNAFWRGVIEEFLEEAWDGCVEAGFVVAYSVESFLAMQKMADPLGKERIVEITPDRQAGEERIVLAGPEEVLKPAITQALTLHQFIDNRDIGQFVGQSVADEAREGDLGLRLKILLYNVPAPPWEGARNEKPRRVTVTIPDVKRSKLDWADIRAACGGQNGYLWGRFRASAKLTNGRRLECFGATKQEAEDRCKAFIALSEAELKTITVTEELKEGDRLVNPGLYKETTRVYPAYAFILNREKVLVGDQGRPVGKYRYRDARFRLELWGGTKPFDWEDIVQDALLKIGLGNSVSL